MLNEVFMNFALETYQKYGNGRMLVFFGIQDEMYEWFESKGVSIKKIYTSLKEYLNGSIENAENLAGQKSKYYVFCAYRSENNENKLVRWGYKEIDDVVFNKPKTISLSNRIGCFTDCYGNKVEGMTQKVTLNIYGINNCIKLSKESTGFLQINVHGNNNFVNLGVIKGINQNTIQVYGNENIFEIENGCQFDGALLRVRGYSQFHIGEGGAFGKNFLAIACAYGLISIGRDALFSEDDVLQAGDGHSIFDVITGKNINSNKSERGNNLLYSVDIGDHVWVGRRAIILGGMTQIGMGSIVGAMSFVKGGYPNNVSIGGIPAKILRRNIAWSHENCAEDIRSCNGYTNLTNI